jgi:ZIP family zinc transporter
LWPFLGGAMLAWFAAAVAGIMVAVAMDELLPTAKEFGSDHTPILGLIAGMAVMALGLTVLHAHAGAH